MMVNCPRCGFTQPKDQYCAKCGVDMLAYKPAAAPLSKKLLGSWTFQVAILAVILVAVYVVIRDRAHKTISERIAEIESAPQTRATEQTSQAAPTPAQQDFSASTNTASTQGAPADATAPTAGFAPPPQQVAGAQPQNSQAETAGAAQPAAPPAEGAPQPASRGASTGQVRSLRISFLEAQRAVIADLASNARNLVESSFTGGVLADLSTRLPTYRASVRTLDTSMDYPVRMNQPIIAFKGARDETTGQNIGITLQLTPFGADETGVTVQAEVLRVLREAGGTLAEQSFQETFVINKGGGAFMSGLLPRRQLTAEEISFYQTASVLRILASRPFQAQQTEFLILIEGR